MSFKVRQNSVYCSVVEETRVMSSNYTTVRLCPFSNNTHTSGKGITKSRSTLVSSSFAGDMPVVACGDMWYVKHLEVFCILGGGGDMCFLGQQAMVVYSRHLRYHEPNW